ncbi:clostripain [Clostridium oceanicum]|uniref:Clostripain n=1 Tax=Clostridium oceanicum TaxID=1543 RepID=A0ABN1JFF3_9CLOT
MLKNKLSVMLGAVLFSFSLIGARPVYAKTVNNSNKSDLKTVQREVEKAKSSGQKVTIMYYCDADNNLESSLLSDIQEMKTGYQDNPNLNLVGLVDRTPEYTNNKSVLGENFSDTRLYKIEHNKTTRLSGKNEFPEITLKGNYEANMGDPNVLKKFINYCKANYKADKYVLIMSNHGGGAREKLKIDPNLKKAICWDDTNDSDCLYMAEISDNLTSKESVDVLAFDACLMGTAEVAYQYKPGNGGFSADSLVASAPSVWGAGFKYDKILSRIKSGNQVSNENDSILGGKEKTFDPETITNKELGALFVEEQKDSTKNSVYGDDQQLSYYDLTKADEVKNEIDKLAVNLSKENEKAEVEKLRGSKDTDVKLMHYFDENEQDDWASYPYFDVYDLCEKISQGKNFSKETKLLATNCMNKIDEMIGYSFGNSNYQGFKEGKNGLSIFMPDGKGKYLFKDYFGRTIGSSSYFKLQTWYNSIDTAKADMPPYGKLRWCKDGQNSKVNKVGNWFELLDSWFDNSNDSKGGVNHYQW